MTTPAPEAIEAARAALSKAWTLDADDEDLATAALSAAAPLMAAQAKAEALREAADLIEGAQKMITVKPGHGTAEEESNFADWDEASRGAWDDFDQSVRFLRARAATIETEATNV